MHLDSDARFEPQTRAPLWKWLHLVAALLSPRSLQVQGLGRLHEAVRFAFPQRNAIFIIVGLTLCVAGLNAIEPLIL
jgi:hypothetical protein